MDDIGSCQGWCKDHSLGSSTSAWDDYKVKLPFVIISKIVGISKKLPLDYVTNFCQVDERFKQTSHIDVLDPA